MLIKTLFDLASKQDDKTNFLRLWATAAGLPDAVTLLPELDRKYGPLLIQSMMEFRDEGKSSSIGAFEDITEAVDCIVYQKQFAGPQPNADLAAEDEAIQAGYPFRSFPPKLVKPEAEAGSVNEHWLSRGYSWCENNLVWVREDEDPAQVKRDHWDLAMSETK